MKTTLLLTLVTLAVLPLHGAPLQGMSAQQALDVAKSGVDPSIQSRLVSVYGTGTPAGIDRWWIIFYDSTVPSHGRAVKVVNGQMTRSYVAKGGGVYSDVLTFPAGQVKGIGKALSAAQTYAAQNSIAYDHVRAGLRLTNGSGLRWRVQLLDGGVNKGFVFVDAASGRFAMYAPAAPAGTRASTGGVVGDAEAAGSDVKNTFLGVGGDLQQFFTGERTVDQ